MRHLFGSVSQLFTRVPSPDAALPHHAAHGFRNVHPGYRPPGFADFLRWKLEQRGRGAPPTPRFELAANDPAALRANTARTTLTWIGHATLLLQMAGRNVLTDPQFSRRASPVQWAGPRRVVPPGIALEDLPAIDAVLISHDHYDSLDAATIRKLHRRGGGRTVFFVPLGLKRWFARRGIDEVIELDWWQGTTHRGLRIMPVPVQHWSKRTPFSSNGSLWSGWAASVDGLRFLFAGDSGYSPDFADIGRRLGPFDLAAIPIGAYAPRWFMRAHHMDPEEAVQVHCDLRSRRSVGIHWGTFPLTDEPLDEPPKRLRAAAQAAGLAPEEFQVLRHGETRVLEEDEWVAR